MNAVILTGPQGSGKTLIAERLARVLGCRAIVDGWWLGEPLADDTLHVTCAALRSQVGARVLSIDEVRDWPELIGAEGAPAVPALVTEVSDAG